MTETMHRAPGLSRVPRSRQPWSAKTTAAPSVARDTYLDTNADGAQGWVDHAYLSTKHSRGSVRFRTSAANLCW